MNTRRSTITAITTLFILFISYLIAEYSLSQKEIVLSIKSEGYPGITADSYYYLPKSIIKINSKVKVVISEKTSALKTNCEIIEQSFTITSETIPDNQNLFLLDYKGYGFSADDVKFVIDSKGLLNSVNIIAEDRLAEIIKTISGATKTTLSKNSIQRSLKSSEKLKTHEFSKIFKILPENLINVNVQNWLINITNNDSGKCYTVDAGFEIKIANYRNSNLSQRPNNNIQTNLSDSIMGIVTKPLKNVTFSIIPKSNQLDTLNILDVNIIDPNLVFVVPIKRSAFVERKQTITLNEGTLLSNQIVKPSSYEGLVSIPINIGKAIASIPAQLISVKIDNTNNIKTLSEAQKELVKLQAELEQLKKQIEESEN